MSIATTSIATPQVVSGLNGLDCIAAMPLGAFGLDGLGSEWVPYEAMSLQNERLLVPSANATLSVVFKLDGLDGL